MVANLTTFIHNTVERDAVIRQGLARGLITPRTLSAHLVKAYPEMGLSMESVRTAIRRSQIDKETLSTQHKNVIKSMKDSKIHLKSGIARVSFTKGDASIELLIRNLKAMELFYGNDTFRIVKGHNLLHILVDNRNLEQINELFSERVKYVHDNVCEITVVLPPAATKTPGIFAALVNEMAINNINILEEFSSGGEINIYVDDKDSQKTFNVLKDMIEQAKRESDTRNGKTK